MIKKIVRPTPDKLGYKDRGKMKWMGLILSDHAEALQKMSLIENKEAVQAKPQQTASEIGQILAQAFHTRKPVAIQTNSLINGQYDEDIACTVLGTHETQIYLKLKNNQLVDMTLEEIRHVEFLNSQIWYQKK